MSTEINNKNGSALPIKQGEHDYLDDDKQKIKPYPVADSRMTAKILQILQ